MPSTDEPTSETFDPESVFGVTEPPQMPLPSPSSAELQKGSLFPPKAEIPKGSLFPPEPLDPGTQTHGEGSNNIDGVGATAETLAAPALAAIVGRFETEEVTEVATGYLELAAYVDKMFSSVTARLDAVERRFCKEIVLEASGDSEVHSQKLISDGCQEVTQNLQLMYTEAFRSGQLNKLDDTVAKLTEALDSVKNRWKEDSRRLWEAMDSHTHELNVDGSEQSDMQSAQGAENESKLDLTRLGMAWNRKLSSGSAVEQDKESMSSLPSGPPQEDIVQAEKKSENQELASITVPSSQAHVRQVFQSAPPVAIHQPAPALSWRSGSLKIPMGGPFRGSYRIISPAASHGGSAQLAPAGVAALQPLSPTGASQAMPLSPTGASQALLDAKALIDAQALLDAPASPLIMGGVVGAASPRRSVAGSTRMVNRSKSPPMSIAGSARESVRVPQWPPVVAAAPTNFHPDARVSWKLPKFQPSTAATRPLASHLDTINMLTAALSPTDVSRRSLSPKRSVASSTREPLKVPGSPRMVERGHMSPRESLQSSRAVVTVSPQMAARGPMVSPRESLHSTPMLPPPFISARPTSPKPAASTEAVKASPRESMNSSSTPILPAPFVSSMPTSPKPAASSEPVKGSPVLPRTATSPALVPTSPVSPLSRTSLSLASATGSMPSRASQGGARQLTDDLRDTMLAASPTAKPPPPVVVPTTLANSGSFLSTSGHSPWQNQPATASSTRLHQGNDSPSQVSLRE